ncbi:hypothetical protein [Burkholderia contaminans]|uniref:hypothetical protein n=1 Tax=Burkholderia contaminans TaxID=488447 RepID=UPI00158ADEC5|nr:hypothetical protein [Burkholderia contaminans]
MDKTVIKRNRETVYGKQAAFRVSEKTSKALKLVSKRLNVSECMRLEVENWLDNVMTEEEKKEVNW